MPNLLHAKGNRSKTEYFWTLTPCILFYLLFIKKHCSCLTYLDADQIFYSSPTPIFNENEFQSWIDRAFVQRLRSVNPHVVNSFGGHRSRLMDIVYTREPS